MLLKEVPTADIDLWQKVIFGNPHENEKDKELIDFRREPNYKSRRYCF
jgi:hypothetical protein